MRSFAAAKKGGKPTRRILFMTGSMLLQIIKVFTGR
jgi:hypothetical protein